MFCWERYSPADKECGREGGAKNNGDAILRRRYPSGWSTQQSEVRQGVDGVLPRISWADHLRKHLLLSARRARILQHGGWWLGHLGGTRLQQPEQSAHTEPCGGCHAKRMDRVPGVAYLARRCPGSI